MTVSGKPPGTWPPRSSARMSGIAGSPGVAIGTVLVLGTNTRVGVPRRKIGDAHVEDEIQRFERAVEQAQQSLREVSARVETDADDSILEAYIHMVGDPTLAGAVRRSIRNEQRCAEWAVVSAIDSISSRLSAVDDDYLRERSHDVEFVGDRLLGALSGKPGGAHLPPLSGPTVVVARDLSPADTAAMVNEPVVGFVTEMGTRTSHTAIMARSLEIPAVVGATGALTNVETGDTIVVDGVRGVVIVRPTPEELKEAQRRSEKFAALTRTFEEHKDLEPSTKDGTPLMLRANVELPDEAALSRSHGAQGIGLYRTEFLYIDRMDPPTEDDQFEVFKRVLTDMKGLPVTLRTFDIGGDKFASSFMVPPEMNPMLGLRAVRLALSRPEVFKVQLRAMVRASAFGDVKIMIPMVSGLSELRAARQLLTEAMDEVAQAGHDYNKDIPLGVMIEVPSAAVMVDVFAREAAFMSIGTNDLIQYALAVDRTSQTMAYLASPFDPAIIRLIAGVVSAGRQWKCPVSICGAMASDPIAAIMLLGLGVHDFSMESAAIPEVREALWRVSRSEAEALATEALQLSTAEEIEHAFVEAFAPRLSDILTGEEQ